MMLFVAKDHPDAICPHCGIGIEMSIDNDDSCHCCEDPYKCPCAKSQLSSVDP